MKRKMSLFLVILLSISLLASCGGGGGTSNSEGASEGKTEDSEASAPAVAENTDFSEKEAPMLHEMVEAGEIPPLEERLPAPEGIMVEPDIVSLGKYGGDLTITTLDSGLWNWGFYAEQNMFRFKQDNSGEVEANVAKEFYPNGDATVWTIKLREGMRWSDGEPFTVDDVIFYYDHMATPALNEDRTAKEPEEEGYYNMYTGKSYSCYISEVNGKRHWAKFDKVNDYEFTVTFAAPKPTFPVAAAVDNKWMYQAKHFFKNYVSRKDGIMDDPSFPFITEEEAIANANRDFGLQFESYSTMGNKIGYVNWAYHIVPSLRSFIAHKDNWDTVGETYVLTRNPYFWKTDSEGRQLPYLDEIKVKIINEMDQVTLQAMAGEFDIYEPKNNDFAEVATALKDTHSLNAWITAQWSTDETLQLNQTVKDLDKRALFQDIRFREALSIAVDRNLLNETLRNGMVHPQQAAVPEGLPGYDAEWSQKWTEFDVEKANTLLDEITELWDRADGTFRKMKGTNKEIEIILSVREPSESANFTSLLQSAFKNIGVKLSIKVDPEYRTAMLSNDVEASVEVTTLSTPAVRPDSIVPMRNVAVWHSAYGKWYEDGKSEVNGGIEPTGDVMELVKAHEIIQSESGPDRQKVVDENVKKIYDLHKKNIWIIGYLSPLPIRNMVNNKLQGIPADLLNVDEFRFMGLARPEQFWWAD